MARRAKHLIELKNFLAFFLFVYLLVAVAGNLAARGGEVFPFFSWSLFSNAYDRVSSLEVEVLAIDGTPLEAPTHFFALGERFAAARTGNMSLVKYIHAISDRHRAGADVEADLRQIETLFMPEAREIDWRLVATTYEPIERHRTGRVIERRIVWTKSTGWADAL